MFGLGSKDEDNRPDVDPETIVTYCDLRSANVTRQAEWDPGDFAKNMNWRVNELGGEVGEVCNVLKKLWREKCGVPGSRDTLEHLAEELADVIICIDLVAMQAGLAPELPDNPYKSAMGTMPDFGCRLLYSMGIIAGARHTSKKFDFCTGLSWLSKDVECCAKTFGIDLSAAVMAKFNATSAKVGLRTRLEFPVALTA